MSASPGFSAQQSEIHLREIDQRTDASIALRQSLDLLGVPVELAVADSPAARHLRTLLADVPRSRRRCKHFLRLTSPGSTADTGRILYHGDHIVRNGMGLAEAIAMLLWYTNQLASRTRSYAVLHAGCVAEQGRGVVLPAAMDMGKSTLVTALVLDGFQYLSDEFAAVGLSEGKLRPYPAPVKLERGSFPLFPHLHPHPHRQVEGETRWHLTAEDIRVGSLSSPVRPAAVVFPEYDPRASCELNRVAARDALCLVMEHALNVPVAGAEAFHALARLVRSVPSYTMVFSDLKQACEAVRSILASPAIQHLGDGSIRRSLPPIQPVQVWSSSASGLE